PLSSPSPAATSSEPQISVRMPQVVKSKTSRSPSRTAKYSSLNSAVRPWRVSKTPISASITPANATIPANPLAGVVYPRSRFAAVMSIPSRCLDVALRSDRGALALQRLLQPLLGLVVERALEHRAAVLLHRRDHLVGRRAADE